MFVFHMKTRSDHTKAMIRFIFDIFSIFGDGLTAIVLFLSIMWFIIFKWQASVTFLLPTNYTYYYLILAFAFAGKVIFY
jgi:hypothetical protein